MRCELCHAELRSIDRFCPSCGHFAPTTGPEGTAPTLAERPRRGTPPDVNHTTQSVAATEPTSTAAHADRRPVVTRVAVGLVTIAAVIAVAFIAVQSASDTN